MIDLQKFADELRTSLLNLNATNRQIADAAGVSVDLIVRIKNGRHDNLRFETARKLQSAVDALRNRREVQEESHQG